MQCPMVYLSSYTIPAQILLRFCLMFFEKFLWKILRILSRDSIDLFFDYLRKLSRKHTKTFSRVQKLFQKSWLRWSCTSNFQEQLLKIWYLASMHLHVKTYTSFIRDCFRILFRNTPWIYFSEIFLGIPSETFLEEFLKKKIIDREVFDELGSSWNISQRIVGWILIISFEEFHFCSSPRESQAWILEVS